MFQKSEKKKLIKKIFAARSQYMSQYQNCDHYQQLGKRNTSIFTSLISIKALKQQKT